MPRVLRVVLGAMALALSLWGLTGCGADKPEEVAVKYVTAIATGDAETVKRMVFIPEEYRDEKSKNHVMGKISNMLDNQTEMFGKLGGFKSARASGVGEVKKTGRGGSVTVMVEVETGDGIRDSAAIALIKDGGWLVDLDHSEGFELLQRKSTFNRLFLNYSAEELDDYVRRRIITQDQADEHLRDSISLRMGPFIDFERAYSDEADLLLTEGVKRGLISEADVDKHWNEYRVQIIRRAKTDLESKRPDKISTNYSYKEYNPQDAFSESEHYSDEGVASAVKLGKITQNQAEDYLNSPGVKEWRAKKEATKRVREDWIAELGKTIAEIDAQLAGQIEKRRDRITLEAIKEVHAREIETWQKIMEKEQ